MAATVPMAVAGLHRGSTAGGTASSDALISCPYAAEPAPLRCTPSLLNHAGLPSLKASHWPTRSFGQRAVAATTAALLAA